MGNAPTQGGFAGRSVHLLGQRHFAFSMQDLACRNWHRLKETGPTNGICTRSGTFTGLNATHTPWPASSVLWGDMRQDVSDAKAPQSGLTHQETFIATRLLSFICIGHQSIDTPLSPERSWGIVDVFGVRRSAAL